MVVFALSPSSNTRLSEELYDPVRVLWAQVLKRAIFDYVMFKDSRRLTERRHYVSARRWLFSPDMGLVDACGIFGWPLERLRERAQEMTRNDVKKIEFRDRNLLEDGEVDDPVLAYGDC